MDFRPHTSFALTDRGFLNIVKRDISRLAESYQFSDTEVGRVNIMVSEMASNLIKHGAIAGELLVKPFGKNNIGLEIICIDQGPGMYEPQRMMEDGVSTAGTPGEGLGAIKRLADEFDLFSMKGVGTVILARIYKKKFKPKAREVKPFDIAVVMVPKAGETSCGDAWAMYENGNTCKILVADGLGHGEFAEEASQEAVGVFLEHSYQPPCDLIRTLHNCLKKTRGAVGNVAVIDLKDQTFSYCGIGNIGGRVSGGLETNKSIISYNGILGHNIPTTIHNHVVPWNNGSLLIMHSDGIKSKWDLNKYKDLHRFDPSITAALLYKEFARGTDDTLVLVGRSRGAT